MEQLYLINEIGFRKLNRIFLRGLADFADNKLNGKSLFVIYPLISNIEFILSGFSRILNSPIKKFEQSYDLNFGLQRIYEIVRELGDEEDSLMLILQYTTLKDFISDFYVNWGFSGGEESIKDFKPSYSGGFFDLRSREYELIKLENLVE